MVVYVNQYYIDHLHDIPPTSWICVWVCVCIFVFVYLVPIDRISQWECHMYNNFKNTGQARVSSEGQGEHIDTASTINKITLMFHKSK